MPRVNGFNDHDTARIARAVRTVERLPAQSLRGENKPVRRGGGIVSDTGTVQGQVKMMLTDHQAGWGFPFMVPMS